jgi:hypothetical protein
LIKLKLHYNWQGAAKAGCHLKTVAKNKKLNIHYIWEIIYLSKTQLL